MSNTAPVLLSVSATMQADLRLGNLAVRARISWENPEEVIVQARSVAHRYPIAANIEDAQAIIGVQLERVEPNTSGLWARGFASLAAMQAQGGVAAILAEGALAVVAATSQMAGNDDAEAVA